MPAPRWAKRRSPRAAGGAPPAPRAAPPPGRGGAAPAEGCRYIDTSRFYGNEEAVGKALARSSVPRGDVWVTTKLLHPRTPPQPDLAFELDKSLRLLQTDYVDLLLIHWPNPAVSLEWALGEFAKL